MKLTFEVRPNDIDTLERFITASIKVWKRGPLIETPDDAADRAAALRILKAMKKAVEGLKGETE